MRFPARTAALLAALTALLASGLSAAGGVPAQAASGSHHAQAATSSLARLPRLSTKAGTDEYGDTRGDATMYMRRLALDYDHLRGDARIQARASLARPNVGPAKTCTANICVHYATSGSDAPSGQITPALVLSTLQRIYDIYQSSGYRMPEPDGNRGGDSRTDIYLANIGSQGYYGYCAPEPNPGSNAHHMPAFCVLDNDYAEFRSGTPITNLDVTAAHEFFHAVQFAYDATEDPWFMESTAVWMEDEVFDAINDNVQYLPFGPLRKPGQSLDKNTAFGVYGGWIFFRWLTEHRPQLTGDLPSVVLSMWQRAAADAGHKDRYSLQAVKGAMKAAGLPLRSAFAKFAAANRDPAHTYSEGAANHYPLAKPTKRFKLRSTHRTSGSVRVDHLAAATARFVPKGKRLRHKKAKLHLTVNMADKRHGSGAMVTVFLRSGKTKVKSVHLSKSGSGAVTVPFSTKVRRVELTMANASTRMRCWIGGRFSCEGQPKDMNVLERFTARPRR